VLPPLVDKGKENLKVPCARDNPEVQQNVTTRFAHVHEQSEFTYRAYLVAAFKFSLPLSVCRLETNEEVDPYTRASFDSEFRPFDYRKLEVESVRRTGHLLSSPSPCLAR